MSDTAKEKLAQVQAILDELDIDAWLLFVRETSDGGDLVLPPQSSSLPIMDCVASMRSIRNPRLGSRSKPRLR